MTRRSRLASSVFVVAMLLAGCGGGGAKTTGNPPPPPPPVTVGLDARPNNATCVAPARAPAGTAVDVVDAFPGLPVISQPVKVLVEPVANPRWFVLRKSGQLVVFDPDAATSWSTYIDLSALVRTNSEGGLLGMAFHPDYPAVPEIFLSYTINGSSTEMRSVISRFILDDIASPSAPGAGTVEEVILEVDQFASNHNGGDIAFGPGRLLYIGFGDGGGGGDPQETGQDTVPGTIFPRATRLVSARNADRAIMLPVAPRSTPGDFVTPGVGALIHPQANSGLVMSARARGKKLTK